LDNNLAKSKKNRQFPLGVIDPQLGTAIQENLSISCRSDETVREIIRGIRFHFTNYVKLLGNGMLEQAQLGLGHSYSRTKVSSWFQCCSLLRTGSGEIFVMFSYALMIHEIYNYAYIPSL
jgi:hypothetical protein